MLKSQIIRCCSLSVAVAAGNCCNQALAQSSFDDFKLQLEEKFNKFKDSKQKEFEDYRNKVNQEFAEYMRHTWDRHEPEPPVPAPSLPEPPEPIVADPEDSPSDDTLPFADVVPVPDEPEPPVPFLPSSEGESPKIKVSPVLPSDPKITPPSLPTGKTIPFDFYGSRYSLPFDNKLNVSLIGVDENSVADAWSALSAAETVDLLRQCVELRDMLCLPDWGYLLLAGKIADAIFPKDHNVATLMQMFLLTQSGYKVRIARQDNDLVILMPCRERIYNYSYVPKNGINYYIIGRGGRTGSIYVFDREFPREKQFSLSIGRQPGLPISQNQSRNFTVQYPVGINVDVSVNQNLIDFYNDYPLHSNWNLYSRASLSEDVKEQLYPALRNAISGRTKKDSANILLHFVQKAFSYQTDDVQFGVERPLFPDETFHYPYSDCEDRAILYSVLVKDLLDLDMVLVTYPGHLATAVRFDEDVIGDYFDIDGKRYTVCDPTYINADIGMAMKQFKNASAEIIRL
ncbi:MAG: hypothetical protein K2K45_02205 [Muribaculaceae bacterium]|nr:hypothetical protein [Muribaculaceae bacterium]